MKKPLLLLLVDDDADDQEFFSMAVSRLSMPVSCHTAGDGKEALEILSTDHAFIPDYIFLDVHMPLVSGPQCLGEIRKIERLKQVPVYMLSTYADSHVTDNCIELGSSGVIKKASSVEDIRLCIEKILEH